MEVTLPESILKSTGLMSELVDWLSQRKRLEILLFLHRRGTVKWSDAHKAINVNDGTYRRACRELERLGLAVTIPIDPVKNRWRLTDFGCLITDVLHRAIRDIDVLIRSEHNTTGRE